MTITYDDITDRVSVFVDGKLLMWMLLVDYARLLGVEAASALVGR